MIKHAGAILLSLALQVGCKDADKGSGRISLPLESPLRGVAIAPHAFDFGKWSLSEDGNDFDALAIHYHLNKRQWDAWPDLYQERSGRVVLRFTEFADDEGYNGIEKVTVCDVEEFWFAQPSNPGFRDFNIVCKGLSSDSSTHFLFGGRQTSARPETFHFRLFGTGFGRLRYIDSDGIQLFFRRT